METVVVGARGSRLAQAMVAEYLARLSGPCPAVKFKNRVVMTDGDRNRTSTLREVSGGSGAFSNQLEQELLEGRIDIAVHSLKDLPTAMPDGLAPPREDIHDALCGSTLAGLRRGAQVGTGSPRRIAQLKALRPDLYYCSHSGERGAEACEGEDRAGRGRFSSGWPAASRVEGQHHRAAPA